MSRAVRFAPLALLALLIVALVWRLAKPVDTSVHSTLEGKEVPAFALPAALPSKPALNAADLATGKPHLVNVFASWCVPCITEMPLLLELKRQGVGIDGIAVRDRPQDIAAFLKERGDPYGSIGADLNSNVQMQFGASGVPETFIVDPYGIVRYQHIGPLEPKDVAIIRDKWASLRK